MDTKKRISTKKILIVEDNHLLLMVHKRIIEKVGHIVTAHVDNAEDAIIEVKKQPPDLILMDIKLNGEMNGIEAVRKINKHFEIPVIYLSGNSNNNLSKKAKESGCIDYLVKPVQMNDLEKSFQKAFSGPIGPL